MRPLSLASPDDLHDVPVTKGGADCSPGQKSHPEVSFNQVALATFWQFGGNFRRNFMVFRYFLANLGTVFIKSTWPNQDAAGKGTQPASAVPATHAFLMELRGISSGQ